MIKESMLNKLMIIIGYIIFTEMILAGLGRPFYVPTRIFLFVIGLGISILYVVKHGIHSVIKYKKYIIFMLLYAGFGILIGIVSGNNFKYILSDTSVFFSILYLVIFGIFFSLNKKLLNCMVELFIKYNLILASITIIIFILSYFMLANKVNFLGEMIHFKNVTNYGLITGYLYNNKFVRVYFANGIYMQVALALCLVKLAYRKDKKIFTYELINIIILLLGIFASSTRGYWMGAVSVFILLPLFIWNSDKKEFLKKISPILIIAIAIIVFFPHKELILNRIASVKEFNSEVSNKIRAIQYKNLINSINQKPIFGWGFGANLLEYYKETKRSGRNFELYYLELVYKTGVIGGGMLLVFILSLFNNAYKAYRRISTEDSYMLKGWALGLISALITGTSNPYFAGAFGFFIIIMFILIIEELQEPGKETI